MFEMNTCVNFGAIPISNDWVMAKNVNSDEKIYDFAQNVCGECKIVHIVSVFLS